jgi:hypothetical protein
VTLTGVVYVPHALVQITGRANVTINPGAGTAVSPPPILGALIAFDLKVDGNGNLTINPDDPPMKMGMSRIHVLPRSSGLTGAGSASADAGQLRQASLVLLGGQPAGARGPSLTPAALSGPGTTAAIPSVATSLPFRSFAATSVTWSGAGTVGHPDDYWIATGFDPLSERFWNDPVAG